ncbi:MAG: phage portal protein [Bacteroidales bacterium]|jgi:hypothetical protein|nr:phage portal protein [Bacteroidales bacterium]
MTIEEIKALPTEAEKITQLRKRDTPLPNAAELWDEWDPFRHEIWADKEKYPDGVKIIRDEIKDERTGKVTQPRETRPDRRNRIPLPIEQDIVDIHTAFTAGKEPKLTCDTDDDGEKELFKVVKAVNRSNKMRFVNKRLVRSVFAEQEVAEYWYAVKDNSFWKKLRNKIRNAFGLKDNVQYKLKCTLWSPFRGDRLYPKFDDNHNLVAFCREYRIKDDNDSWITKFMYVDDKEVKVWTSSPDWTVDKSLSFQHHFGKIPVIYSYSPVTLCHNIKPMRESLEKLVSDYADCIDYNFYPKPVVEGDMVGVPTKENGDVIQIRNGGKVYYLTWNQTPENAKLEFDFLMERIYSMTKTPRLSVDALKGIGQVPSGTSFKFIFMGTLLAVDNHAEIVGEHFQRRYNFLPAAIGSINSYYSKAAESIDIDAEVDPYTIDNLEEKVELAVKASGGAVASRKTGVIMAGIVDEVDDELREMQKEDDEKAPSNNTPNAVNTANADQVASPQETQAKPGKQQAGR